MIEDSRKDHGYDPETGAWVGYLYTLTPLDDAGKYLITAQCQFCHTDAGDAYVAGALRVTVENKTYDGESHSYGIDAEEGCLSGAQGSYCCGLCTDVGNHTLTFHFDENQDPIEIPFTVTPAPLTVTANDATVGQNGAFPALSYTAEGFLTYTKWSDGQGETEVTDGFVTEPTVQVLDADGNEVTDTRTPGTYRIVFSGGVNDNYAITYREGTLTVTEHTVHHFEDNNGFCTECDAYEPATLVTEENFASLGLTEDYVGYYAIGNAGQLYWFAADPTDAVLIADIVVNGNVLTEDGELSGNAKSFRAWTPVFNYGGTFDGNGHTISGLYFNDGDAIRVGLFGIVASGATVRNVGVIDSFFLASQTVGGVVGENDGTVENCYYSGSVTATYDGYCSAGGIVGHNLLGKIEGCHNTGTVTGVQYIGGVVGRNEGTVTGCYNTGAVCGADSVGGVAGAIENSGTVGESYNTGDVVAAPAGNFQYAGQVGGVVGNILSGSVSGCYHIGSVTATGSGNYSVGGVVGKSYLSTTVTDCYNAGSVSGEEMIGGVIEPFRLTSSSRESSMMFTISTSGRIS